MATTLPLQEPLSQLNNPNPIDEKGTQHGEDSDESSLEASSINEEALIRELDWRLLPATGILYLLSFLDRSNGMISPKASF